MLARKDSGAVGAVLIPLVDCDDATKLATALALLTDEIRVLREQAAVGASKSGRKAVDQSKKLLSLKEAARELGVDCRTTLRDLIATGQIKTVPGTRGVRIPRAETERLIHIGFPKPGASIRKSVKKSKNPPPKNVGTQILALKI